MRFFLSCLSLMVLAEGVQAQTQEEVAFAAAVLTQAQDMSFHSEREYCGTIGVDEFGRLVASGFEQGHTDSCQPHNPENAVEVIASFHTHGSYDRNYDSEVPSVSDVESDMAEGIDGWVATPGGRLWFVDGRFGVTWQVCGVGCLPQDPDFRPERKGTIKERYTLEQLERRASEW